MVPNTLTRGLWADVRDLQRTVDLLIGGGPAGRGLHGAHGLVHESRRLFPRLAVRESDEAYVVTGDVPGLTPEALGVTFEDGVLTLAGQAPEAETADGWTARHTERRRWSFERRVRFAEAVDVDAIDAEVRHGVLTITLPKAQGPEAVRVTVRG